MNIVLHEPEMPQNTGNIGRSCAATGSRLHLIKPLGFKINDKLLKRAGLDYWESLDVSYYDDFEDFCKRNNHPRIIMATTKAKRLYTEVEYGAEDFIMFGKESGGIPENILWANTDNCVRIPMSEGYRSLNLANSVAIVLYEALRCNNFRGLY